SAGASVSAHRGKAHRSARGRAHRRLAVARAGLRHGAGRGTAARGVSDAQDGPLARRGVLGARRHGRRGEHAVADRTRLEWRRADPDAPARTRRGQPVGRTDRRADQAVRHDDRSEHEGCADRSVCSEWRVGGDRQAADHPQGRGEQLGAPPSDLPTVPVRRSESATGAPGSGDEIGFLQGPTSGNGGGETNDRGPAFWSPIVFSSFRQPQTGRIITERPPLPARSERVRWFRGASCRSVPPFPHPAMTDTGAAMSSAPAQQPSFWEDLIDIFVSPVEVFRRRQYKSAWPALLFVTIAIGVISYFTFNAMAPLIEGDIRRGMAAALAKNPQMTQEMADKMTTTSMNVGRWTI